MASSPPAPSPSAALRVGMVCLLLFVGFTPARAEAPPWQWPLPPPHQVIAPFDAPEHRYGPGHRGIDIAAPVAGAAVRAVAPGTIRFSGMVAGRGVVSVAHADGLLSTYEPVAGTVAAGEQVVAGTELGTLVGGSELSHCPGAICLHLGARRGEDYMDPMLLLGGRGPSVLLPWAGGPGSSSGPGSSGDGGGTQPAMVTDVSPDGRTSAPVVPAGPPGGVDRTSEHVREPLFPEGEVHGHRLGPRPASRA